MFFFDELFIVIIACLALGVLSYLKRVLTLKGSVAAAIVGLIIGIAGGLSWILLLLLFLVTSFIATRYKFSVKKSRGLHEGKRGERGWRNVTVNGLVPVVIALLSLEGAPYPTFDRFTGSVLFLSAVAIAASDTLASELGVLSKKTWLITNMKRVRAGIDGGISYPGEFWAFMAAFYTGLIGAVVFAYLDPDIIVTWVHVLIITFVGFLGCQVDSVIGATIETKGYVSKLTNNLISISIGTVIAWMLMLVL